MPATSLRDALRPTPESSASLSDTPGYRMVRPRGLPGGRAAAGPTDLHPSENPRHAQPSRGESRAGLGAHSSPPSTVASHAGLLGACRHPHPPARTPVPPRAVSPFPATAPGPCRPDPCPVPGGAWHQPAQTPARPETRAGPARAGRCRPRLAPGALGAPRCPPVLSRTPPRSAGSHGGRGASRPASARLQAAGAPAGISLLTWEALHLHR